MLSTWLRRIPKVVNLAKSQRWMSTQSAYIVFPKERESPGPPINYSLSVCTCVDEIHQLVEESLSTFRYEDCVRVLGRLCHPIEEIDSSAIHPILSLLVPRMEEMLLFRSSQISPDLLADTAFMFAKLNTNSSVLLVVLSAEMQRRGHHFSMKHLAMTFWAISHLRISTRSLFHSLLAQTGVFLFYEEKGQKFHAYYKLVGIEAHKFETKSQKYANYVKKVRKRFTPVQSSFFAKRFKTFKVNKREQPVIFDKNTMDIWVDATTKCLESGISFIDSSNSKTPKHKSKSHEWKKLVENLRDRILDIARKEAQHPKPFYSIGPKSNYPLTMKFSFNAESISPKWKDEEPTTLLFDKKIFCALAHNGEDISAFILSKTDKTDLKQFFQGFTTQALINTVQQIELVKNNYDDSRVKQIYEAINDDLINRITSAPIVDLPKIISTLKKFSSINDFTCLKKRISQLQQIESPSDVLKGKSHHSDKDEVPPFDQIGRIHPNSQIGHIMANRLAKLGLMFKQEKATKSGKIKDDKGLLLLEEAIIKKKSSNILGIDGNLLSRGKILRRNERTSLLQELQSKNLVKNDFLYLDWTLTRNSVAYVTPSFWLDLFEAVNEYAPKNIVQSILSKMEIWVPKRLSIEKLTAEEYRDLITIIESNDCKVPDNIAHLL